MHIGTDVTLNMKMLVGVSETMTVTTAAPLIETERSQVSAVVNEAAIENLPTNGRNFIDFVLTTPGVVKDVRLGDISFAGQFQHQPSPPSGEKGLLWTFVNAH